MRVYVSLLLMLIGLLSVSPGNLTSAADPVRVTLDRSGDDFQLLRNGQPYSIKGVGGDSHLTTLAAAGGNSIRTWSVDKIDRLLDEAQQNGLTVCVGLWLGHERHGFNYQDESAVLGQLDQCLAAVKKYKDHPAVLLWGIGNEMEGDGTNPAVWYAIDHIARETKRIDPDHPTMTVIAELGDHKLQSIERFCPNIDIVGVNSYGGISTLAERYREAGGSKPYIVTEHGPLGPWEVGKTRWGSPVEATSTGKADKYADGYRLTVAGQPGLCLGSYAFLWGHKQETTATWFGMLLPDGSRLGAADAMTFAWTGKPPANRCPRIESLALDRTDNLKPGRKLTAKLVASDPENDALTIKWVLRQDSGTVGVGGDFQAEETPFADAVAANGASATVTVPDGGGGYRLFGYVFDGHGGAAVANVPFFIDAPIRPVESPKANLPFALYSDESDGAPYVPSGYMGNTSAIAQTLDCEEKPHSGQTCLKVEYRAGDNWGGVLWQSPPQDWDGSKPGGLNLTGAREVEFSVRGARGGEVVSFMLGVVDGNHPYRDTAKAELKDVRLTPEWQTLRIPLDGRDLTRIKTGFGWSLAGQGQPVTFYLDNIRYVK
ncbi:glycosyl hydrolase family 2 [bacterium]|nr:glycosyl hydrolase family 2 [bacterium]